MGNIAEPKGRNRNKLSRSDHNRKTGTEKGGWYRVRHDFVNSEEYSALSGNAVKVLTKLMAQYNGSNNGDFSAPQNKASEMFGMSNPTLTTALKELIKNGFIIVSRQGGKHQCSLYAVTCWAIDECKGKLDIRPTTRPPDNWKQS